MVRKEEVEEMLRKGLNATEVDVVDISGGCGASFEVYVVSSMFEKKRLLQRHALVMETLQELMKGDEIHALSIKKTKTPEEMSAT